MLRFGIWSLNVLYRNSALLLRTVPSVSFSQINRWPQGLAFAQNNKCSNYILMFSRIVLFGSNKSCDLQLHGVKWHHCACSTTPLMQKTKKCFGEQLHWNEWSLWVWQSVRISWISLLHQSGCRCAGVLWGVKAGRGECTCVSVAPKARKLQFDFRQFVQLRYQTPTDLSVWSSSTAHVLHFHWSQSELLNQSN